MKTKMIILGFIGGLSFYTFSQSTTATNTGVSGRFLGYSNNFELLTRTNNVNRMKLNGNLNYSIDGYNGVNQNIWGLSE